MTTESEIIEWAAERGIFQESTPELQFVKLMTEIGELGDAMLRDDIADIEDGIGDAMVVLTNLACFYDLSADLCKLTALKVIQKRKGRMINGAFVKDTDERAF